MKKIFFTPGPTQLFDSVPQHIEEAIGNDICSISHRGREFEEVFHNTVSNLRKLLSLPSNCHVFFTSSSTESMERVIENCAAQNSYHFVNGSFSHRFYSTALELKKSPAKTEAELGKGFDFGSITIPDNAELICITQNETSTGVAIGMDDIYDIKRKNPEKIVAIDIVSSCPCINVDYTFVDCAFFSVQKCFGLPAGLGVVIAGSKAIGKAKFLQESNCNIGSYHSFLSLLEYASKNQTPETPNILLIYLLGKICEEFNEIGLQSIQQEIEKKAGMIYDFFDSHPKYKPFVKDKKFRSKTTIAVSTFEDTTKIRKRLSDKGFIVGSGYAKLKDTQIRIANFPMHKAEDVERMLNYIE